jgi:drug/metabolite transporter superfamily protein YnfA
MDILLSVLVLAAFAFLAGAFVLWRKGAPRKQALLMVVVAAILLANVLIWTLPDASGESPAQKAGALGE